MNDFLRRGPLSSRSGSLTASNQKDLLHLSGKVWEANLSLAKENVSRQRRTNFIPGHASMMYIRCPFFELDVRQATPP